MNRKDELFVQQLLEERDAFYRENSKLKSQLSGFDDFAAERASYSQQVQEKDQIISRQQRKFDFEGLELLEEEKELAVSAKEEIEQYKQKKVVEKPKKKAVRKPLPESLPREEFHVYPKDIDLENSTELAPEVTEVLERDPARWYVRQIIRHKYVVKTEGASDDAASVNQTIATAPMPLLPIPKSYAGATVLADMIINKYVFHLPFYRQIEMFKTTGDIPSGINGKRMVL